MFYGFFLKIGSIDDPSSCVIDIEGLAVRLHESIVAREYLELRHNPVEDDGLIGLLNLMCNVLKHNPPFKTSKLGKLLLDQVSIFITVILVVLLHIKNYHLKFFIGIINCLNCFLSKLCNK